MNWLPDEHINYCVRARVRIAAENNIAAHWYWGGLKYALSYTHLIKDEPISSTRRQCPLSLTIHFPLASPAEKVYLLLVYIRARHKY